MEKIDRTKLAITIFLSTLGAATIKTSYASSIKSSTITTAHATPEMYDPKDCPVIGNTSTKKYHVAGGQYYAKMLRLNKNGENRRCFKSEADAVTAEYVRSKR